MSELFAFTALPLEIQSLIAQQLPLEDLLQFRWSCSSFFNISNTLKGVMAVSDDVILYVSGEHTFQMRSAKPPHDWVDPPTSEFWKTRINFILRVKLLTTGDENHFLLKLQRINFKFRILELYTLPQPFVKLLLFHLKYINLVRLCSPTFCSDEFLMTDVLKHTRGEVRISGYYDMFRENMYDITEERVPVKGINNVIKLWLNDTYRFRKFYLEPIHINTPFPSFLEDIPFAEVYRRSYHHTTVLRSIDQQLITNEMHNLKASIAVKKQNSNKCLVINIFDKWIDSFTCRENEIIRKTLNYILSPLIVLTSIPKDVLDYVCQQKLFE